MFVQLRENPAPTIVHTDMEWEDILETIDWLFGDRITPLKRIVLPFFFTNASSLLSCLSWI